MRLAGAKIFLPRTGTNTSKETAIVVLKRVKRGESSLAIIPPSAAPRAIKEPSTVLDEVWSFRSLGLESVASAATDTLGVANPLSNPLANPLGGISSVLGGSSGSKSLAELTGLGASAAKCAPEATQVVGAILGTDSVSSLIGLVTTNSLTYSAGPPKYTDGFLNYKVAGLRKNPDDSTFQGSCDLVMSSKIARCIYGFEGSAPLYATVSVINSDGGETTLAAESVKEEGGWLRLKARGFTFSSPTLKIKLTQNSPTAPTAPAQTAATTTPAKVETATATATKKRTITCVKGKLTRKVSGAAPKCPTGFKKK